MYKSFDSTPNKIKKLWDESLKQESQIPDDNIIIFSDKYLEKAIHRFIIIQDEDINWSGTYYLVDFPEWAIPMLRPVAFFSLTGDGFDANLVDFSGGAEISLTYLINKLGTNSYVFKYEANTDASFDGLLLANVYLYFINNRNYELTNKAKK